ncbi:MAG: cytochrome c oxidase subunit I [bacterium TMED161]|nr:MAG: cytochrome c oxidase subunit I [bacterium TMED161]|tara:strand:+ start:56195 stop:57820 length:1626 start_codon:yes stop_codon:yes gene_type:complete
MREYLEKNYLNEETTIKSWLFTVDHKRIGLMYLFAIMFFFAVGGFLALMMRLELLTPAGGDILDKNTYNVFYTLHGAIMIFMFIIPSVPAAMGNIIMPIMLGTKDVAFPRLNLASWYVYVVGSSIGIFSIISGGVDTGWTFYTPYSSSTDTAVISMTFAVLVLGFSSIFTGINFIVTIHKMRAPGITWFSMPLFVWSLYATALIQILATPVIAVTMLLLIMERTFQVGIFDPAMGGDPVLFQHFFWFYSHPAVYIMILPGMGIISELISTFSKKKIFGYTYIAASTMAIALFGFLVWGHHMFTSQSEFAALIFSIITYLTALPSGVKIFNWLATLYKAKISYEAPMLYAINFLLLFAIGGLTGIFLGTLSVDIMLHDTYFVVAHFHYVMMGGTVIAFLGGLHYWWPKIWGRMYSEKWARISAILIFFGFNLTFIPQFIMGSLGMPRRYWQYDGLVNTDIFHFYHQLSTLGSWFIAVSFIIMLVYLVHSIKYGKVAGSNPWGALTLEWQTPSPAPAHNFLEEPKITHGPYDYDKVEVERTID